MIKIDISTGDIITPGAVEYSYKLLFENRFISIMVYNLETLLAEKLETIMARSTANTRMRDFYDIHILLLHENINFKILHDAFMATSRTRRTLELIPQLRRTLETISNNKVMETMWNNYCKNNYFVGNITWSEVNASAKQLGEAIINSFE